MRFSTARRFGSPWRREPKNVRQPNTPTCRSAQQLLVAALTTAAVLLGLLAATPAHALHPPPQPTAAPGVEGRLILSPGAVWGCPMCETVRRAEPGSCPQCGMALARMDAEAAHAGSAAPQPLMPGLPNWLFFTIALLILTISFVFLQVRRRRPRSPHGRARRFDLLRIPGLRALLEKRWFPFVLQLPVVVLFVVVVAAGFFGNPDPARNIAPVLTWTVWWASLVLLILFLGKLWCTACPWNALADWLAKLVPRLDRPWPRVLRNIWPATILFVLLTWLELGYGVTGKPWLTAALGLLMVALATGTLVVFERKAFCRYACLVGRVSGLYATFASTELRAADRDTCKRCTTKDCYRGNDRGAPCPTHEFLGTMEENTYCILCMECVKSCPVDNVAWNVRPWGADLLESVRPQKDEAYLALLMLSMAAFHGFTMTMAWDRLVLAIGNWTGLGPLAAFSLGMAAMLLVPVAVYYAICVLMKWFARDRKNDVGTLFVRFAYSLLPIALFYHLAHNLQHVLFEGKKLLRLSSDPFGWGWNLFGTALMPVDAVLPLEVGWALQVMLVLLGHVYAIVIADRTAQSLYDEPRAATASQIPMLVAMLLFSFQSLWLLSQPMLMRTAM